MSEQNVDEIRSHYKAAARGEVRSLRWLDERINVEHRPPVLPGVLDADPIDEPRWQPERYIDLRERVLVRVKLSGRARNSGTQIETRLAHLWTVRSGNATSLVIYHDWETGLSAAGVVE